MFTCLFIKGRLNYQDRVYTDLKHVRNILRQHENTNSVTAWFTIG
jgi:hypothetical protein